MTDWKKVSLLLLLSCVLCCCAVFAKESRDNSIFSADYSTTYPLGQRKDFTNLEKLFAYFEDPRKVIPPRDEFETDARYRIKLREFEEKLKKSRVFTIRFKPYLGKYSHELGGFPLDLAVSNKKERVLNRRYEDIGGENEDLTAIEKVYGGCVLLSDYWNDREAASAGRRGKLKAKPVVQVANLFVPAKNIDVARAMKNDQNQLICQVACINSGRREISIHDKWRGKWTGGSTRRPKYEYHSRTTTYDCRDVEISRFQVCWKDKTFDVIRYDKAEQLAAGRGNADKEFQALRDQAYPLLAEVRDLRKRGKLSDAFAKACEAEKKYTENKRASKDAINLQCWIMNDRFIDNRDGTISDRVTGLTWTKIARYGSFDGWLYVAYKSESKKTEPGRIYSRVEKTGLDRPFDIAGHEDWRIPDLSDFRTIAVTVKYSVQRKIFNWGEYGSYPTVNRILFRGNSGIISYHCYVKTGAGGLTTEADSKASSFWLVRGKNNYPNEKWGNIGVKLHSGWRNDIRIVDGGGWVYNLEK